MGRPDPQPQVDIPNAGGTASRMSPKPLDQWAKNPTGVSLRSWAFRTANYLDELERERRERLEAQARVKQLMRGTRTWSLSENSNASRRSWSWSARDVCTTIVNASA
jgi:hypothetical protein